MPDSFSQGQTFKRRATVIQTCIENVSTDCCTQSEQLMEDTHLFVEANYSKTIYIDLLWEKDLFFSAAEEVQESADRMESTYRTLIAALKDTNGVWNVDQLRMDLRTTLGTTKWQLEEFEHATRSSYSCSCPADHEAKDRHQQFIVAIKNQIMKIESYLTESTISHGKPPRPWVRLDEGERNELALFLSGASSDMTSAKAHAMNRCSRSSAQLVEMGLVNSKDEKFPIHRRTASASADIGSWKIMVADDLMPHNSSNVNTDPPPRKISSFSSLLSTVESSISQLKWSRNGYKKVNLTDQPQNSDTILPKLQNLSLGSNVSNEKCKSRIEDCDDCYDKELHGWYGTIRRQLQRSQYHMQYSRPVQIVFSIIFLLCLLVLLAFR